MKELIYGKIEADGRQYGIFFFTDINMKKILVREGLDVESGTIVNRETGEKFGGFERANVRELLTEIGCLIQ